MTAEPFRVGDRVRVIRARHGWHDGAVSAVVTWCRQRPTGTWEYQVRDDAGTIYEVRHTRDLKRA